jgi:predicted kinase
MTQITVVCGPPCSGKTTWVQERARPTDAVVDYDDIAQQLGSPRTHGHHYRYHQPTEALIAQVIDAIRQGRFARAWVIRTEQAEAQRLADDLQGELVVIDAPDDVLLERAKQRPDPQRTADAIKAWRASHPCA